MLKASREIFFPSSRSGTTGAGFVKDAVLGKSKTEFQMLDDKVFELEERLKIAKL